MVFHIGMRINRPLKVRSWFPVAAAMPAMLWWLQRHPQAGLFGWYPAWMYGGAAIVQHWRSFEDLDAFARQAAAPHLPAWKRFNKAIGGNGDVGVWHETIRVRRGDSESIYVNMPEVGIAAIGDHLPVGSTRQTSPQRMGDAPADEAPVTPY